MIDATLNQPLAIHKIKFKMTAPDNKSQDKEVDFDGSQGGAFLSFAPAIPGEYKIEAALFDDSGKEINKKSGSFTVKGAAPAPAETKKDDADQEADDEKTPDK